MRFRKITYLAIILLSIGAASLVRLHFLNQKPLQIDRFSTFELVEVYLLGIAMVSFGYPLFPEAAEEHFRLMLHHEQQEPIEAKSGFFLKSKIVRSAAEQACQDQRPVRLWWNMSEYQTQFDYPTYIEARSALALNGGSVICDKGKPYALINVSYPQNAIATFVRLGGYPILQVQEGLFHLLEQKGWYQSYHYKWALTDG